MLRLTSFKQFFNTRQTLCNIIAASNTAGMESTHGQLSTRFADRLSSNSAYCLTYIYITRSCQVTSITFTANTIVRFTSQNTTNLNLCPDFANCLGYFLGNIFIDGIQNITLLISDILRQITTHDTVKQGFNYSCICFAFSNSFNFNAFNSVVTDFNIAHRTICQNCIYYLIGYKLTFFSQNFSSRSNNIFSQILMNKLT